MAKDTPTNPDLDYADTLWKAADAFLRDLHPDLKADHVVANPPFNVSDWSGQLLEKDPRWQFGKPPGGNANYAWIQHFIYHLAQPNGRGGGVAGFVMANGSLSSNTGGEGEIRKRIVEADSVDCIVALPAHLFYTTGIPVCLWFLTRDKTGTNPKRHRIIHTLAIWTINKRLRCDHHAVMAAWKRS